LGQLHQLGLRGYLLIGTRRRLVAGQVEPPLVDRERLVLRLIALGALILLK